MAIGESLFELLYADPMLPEGVVEAYIGLFALNRETGARQARQFPVEGWRESLVWASQTASAGLDVYFSPALLKELPREGRRGIKEQYLGSRCLWVDIDPEEGRDQRDIRVEINEFTPGPSVVVDSGRGIHAYWVLDHLETNHKAIEHRNYWLATQLKGDHVHSIDHVLRVPGTLNWKPQK